MLLGLVVLVTLSVPALAQQPVALSMEADTSAVELDPGQEQAVTLTLANDGDMDGTVSLSVDASGQGWTTSLSEETVQVPAGSEETVTLTATAPEERPAEPEDLSATVTGTIQDATGQFSASDSVEVTASLTPASPPPPPDPFPWGLTLAGVGLVAAAAAGGYVWYQREREKGIEMVVGDSVDVRPGGESYVPLEITNTSDRRRVTHVEVASLPGDWGGGVNLNKIELDPGEAKGLWLAVKPPSHAEPGAVDLTVTAKPADAKRFELTDKARVHVVPAARDPENPSRNLIAPIGVHSPTPYEDAQFLDD